MEWMEFCFCVYIWLSVRDGRAVKIHNKALVVKLLGLISKSKRGRVLSLRWLLPVSEFGTESNVHILEIFTPMNFIKNDIIVATGTKWYRLLYSISKEYIFTC